MRAAVAAALLLVSATAGAWTQRGDLALTGTFNDQGQQVPLFLGVHFDPRSFCDAQVVVFARERGKLVPLAGSSLSLSVDGAPPFVVLMPSQFDQSPPLVPPGLLVSLRMGSRLDLALLRRGYSDARFLSASLSGAAEVLDAAEVYCVEATGGNLLP